MNIFEGTRRIVILITIVSVAYFLVYSITNGSDPLRIMLMFTVTGPDGRTFEVTTPEGATSNYAIAYANTTYYSGASNEKAFIAKITEKNEQWWTEKWENIWKEALGLIQGLTVLWVLSWFIGWIVRGFLGIPMGQDRKPETEV